MPRKPFTRIASLMFDGTPLFEMAVPLSVFGVDRTDSGAPRFELMAVAGDKGAIVSTAGVQLQAPHDLSALEQAEVIVVPSWRDPTERPPQAVLDALNAAHDRGATILGLCLGAFVLAAAGLLDGRRVATHWLHASVLATQHRELTVDASVLFVDDGDILTSAGTASGIDACLHLVRTAYGARAAIAIARRMVVPPQRSGDQAQFIEQAVPLQPEGDDLSDVVEFALHHLDQDLQVDDLADRSHLSRRTFDRHFRARLGSSPNQWLLQQRILHAQRLLEDTDLPVEGVAAAVGFTTAMSMRPHFRRIAGVSPQRYRENYRPKRAS